MHFLFLSIVKLREGKSCLAEIDCRHTCVCSVALSLDSYTLVVQLPNTWVVSCTCQFMLDSN